MWGKNAKNSVRHSVFGPVFRFVRLQVRPIILISVKIRSTGIKVYSLGINTYSSEYKYSTVDDHYIIIVI